MRGARGPWGCCFGGGPWGCCFGGGPWGCCFGGGSLTFWAEAGQVWPGSFAGKSKCPS